MFDLDLGEDLALVRATAASFAAERLRPAMREHEQDGAVRADVRVRWDELELTRIDLPEALGGAALSSVGKAVVLEALAHGDAAAAIALDGVGPAAYPIAEMGGSADLLAGRGRGAVLVDDDEEHLVIDGDRVKGIWPWAPVAEPCVVIVLRGARAWVMRENVSAASVVPSSLHAAGASELAIDGRAAAVLESARGALRARARCRVWASALLVGVAKASLDHARAYTQERVAFGRPVAHHQGIAFLIAELATALDAARLSLHRAAWVIDGDGDPTAAAASAFLDAADAALACGEEGVQLLGGHGYMQDHPVEKWMREARTLAQLFGGRGAALDVLADRVLGASARLTLDSPSWESA